VLPVVGVNAFRAPQHLSAVSFSSVSSGGALVVGHQGGVLAVEYWSEHEEVLKPLRWPSRRIQNSTMTRWLQKTIGGVGGAAGAAGSSCATRGADAASTIPSRMSRSRIVAAAQATIARLPRKGSISSNRPHR